MNANLTIKLGLSVLLLNLLACTTTNSIAVEEPASTGLKDLLALNINLFGQPVLPDPESKIFELTQQQKLSFLEFYHAPQNAKHPGHVRLYQYLENFGYKFSYSDYTKTAELTEQTASGNCISLAVLTTAYARLVGLQLKYQLVKRVPIYQKFGSVIFNAEHVRTMVTEHQLEIVDGAMIIPSYSIIDYYPSRYSKVDGYISKDEFIGRYYRNLAAEALGNDDNNRAFWLAKYSLENEVESADAINILAVTNRRSGHFDMAERLFEYGLKVSDNKLGLLKNYKILLIQQARIAEVEQIDKQLAVYDDRNPFDMLQEAERAFTDNNIIEALEIYKTVIIFAPYLHQAYFGIAKSEYKRGNLIAANEALQRALYETYDGKIKTVYEAKLAVLKSLSLN